MKKIILTLIVLSFIGSFLALPYMPAKIPMHWNISGEVNSYQPRERGVWLMPILMILMAVMFAALPEIDPKKEKYKLFQKEWEIIQLVLIGYFTYLHFVVLYISINPEIGIMRPMFLGLGLMFILTGNYMSKIRQNYFIGIKVPWTLASEENWNKTHRFAGWCFVLAGLAMIIEVFVNQLAPMVTFGIIILAAVLPIVYSFLLFKKEE